MKKYLLYAIGEIILVVIGILIAVSINNANERNNLKKQRHDLASKVLAQMSLDTLNLNKVIYSNLSRKPIYDTVLRDTEPEDKIKACERCPYLIVANMTVANTDPKVKSLLADAVLVNDSLSVRLRAIEQTYVDELEILKLLENSIVTNLKDNMDYLQANYAWFAQFISNQKCNSECLDYFESNPDFRNRVAYIELLIMTAYQSEISVFRDEITEHIDALENYIIID